MEAEVLELYKITEVSGFFVFTGPRIRTCKILKSSFKEDINATYHKKDPVISHRG